MALPFHKEVVRAALCGDRKSLQYRLALESHEIGAMASNAAAEKALENFAGQMLRVVLWRALWESEQAEDTDEDRYHDKVPLRALAFLDDRDLCALQASSRSWYGLIRSRPTDRAGLVRDALSLASDALFPMIPQDVVTHDDLLCHPAVSCRAARATMLKHGFVRKIFSKP